MTVLGYCHDCGAWVAVSETWTCPKGHAAERINGWYDSGTGLAVDPAAPQTPDPDPAPESLSVVAPVPDAAPAPNAQASTRDSFLIDLVGALQDLPAYSAAWGQDTDLVIESNPMDGSWGAGHKRASYNAALKAVESERTVYFWEVLKEHSAGLTFGTFESESYSTVGTKRSGTKREAAIGPGSASWEWGYGTLRKLVEQVAARHGFTVSTVLMRKTATW